ncbi:MAG TPA: hypothetical protein VEA19_01030 [Actinomycetota bacterium]|nr:hypothetical protein [Actinomycetota bacterium]
MVEIQVTPLDEDAFGVRVREGTNETNHKVTVPDEMLEVLGLPEPDLEELVRESFEFLLEREPATSILGDFRLDAISEFFPEYLDEIRTRLS